MLKLSLYERRVDLLIFSDKLLCFDRNILTLHGQICTTTGIFDILISLFTERLVKMPEHSHLGEIKLDLKRLTHAPFRSSVRLVLRRGDTSAALECLQMVCFWEDDRVCEGEGGQRGGIPSRALAHLIAAAAGNVARSGKPSTQMLCQLLRSLSCEIVARYF